MEWTRTPRERLAVTYPVQQSAVAEAFLRSLWERFGIEAEAVYVESGVSLYVHRGHSRPFLWNGELEGEILALLRSFSGEGQGIYLEYIDDLTLWHSLSRRMGRLNRLPAVVKCGAKLYVGFDSKGAPRPLALLNTVPRDREAVCDALTEAVYAYLKPRDIRDAVTRESVRPIVRTYASLTAEERFALARENTETV